jgi:hypothetical protein
MSRHLLINKKTKLPKVEKGAKLSGGARVHAHDVDHNVHHGTPHIHLNDGTVLNVFSGVIYRKKVVVGKMKSKELLKIRTAIMENMISVAEGKYNLDGKTTYVHSDTRDPLPTKVHVHTDSLTFSADKKVYNVGTQNIELNKVHAKLDVVPNSFYNNFSEYYKKHLTVDSIQSSLLNKLNILVKSTNICREYFKDSHGVDFESHNLDAF